MSIVIIGVGAEVPIAYADGTSGLDASAHTKEEIIAYVNSRSWNNDTVTYSEEPSVTFPYARGRVSDASEQGALNYLNICRCIADVNEVLEALPFF